MFDVIKRALHHPIDYSGIWRTTDLELVEKIDEGGGVFSFVMKADELPAWKAGQHAIFTLPGQKVEDKTWRPFSVASAPHEGVIRIGTIIPPEPSSFKQHLAAMKPGGKIRMHGPYGELYLRENTGNIVGVAGGIGITPFRSIIADLAHRKGNTALTLIYSAKEKHTYQSELDRWSDIQPNIRIIYTHTAEEVNAELEKLVRQHHNDAHYMLSGAPKMIEALRDKLSTLGVSKDKVCNDPFKGY